MEQVQKKNILGTEPIGGLLRQFAVPSIIAMLVGALYNIVDQFFIGRSVGELGNAATNVAFPLTISCVALALLFGIGGAASFNLTLGGGDREKALFYIGNAATLLFGSADAALFRFAGQCAGVCQNVYGYHGFGISISDSDQRRRASGEGGRKPA